MPPKVRNIMNKNPTTMTDLNQKFDTVAEGVADTAGSGMRADDVLFLIDCLQNSMGGQVQVSSLETPLSKHRAFHIESCVEAEHLPHLPYTNISPRSIAARLPRSATWPTPSLLQTASLS